MVLVERISAGDNEKLDRVVGYIKRFFQNNLQPKENLEIQWGTENAFKLMDEVVTKGLRGLTKKEG